MNSVVGTSVPQVTAREKILGRAQYVGDINIAGMLFGKVLRSPYPHARIADIDATRARKLPGVVVVVTGEDTPDHRWGAIRKDQHILAKGKVRFAGEEVAAVAAVDESTAMDALELIRVGYEELPAVLDTEIALKLGAPEIHAGTGNLAYEVRINRGDVEAGFRSAAAVYDASYEVTYQYAGYMEPMGTLAAVDGNGRLTIWTPAQSVFSARARVADALGWPPSRLRVIQTVTGGGFGGKVAEDANAPIAALLAIRAGRPVRLVNTRLEDFLGSRAGVPARIWLKMGLAADGEIVAKDSVIIADNGAYTGLAPAITYVMAMRSDSMHRLKNVRAHARLVYTNKIPSGAFRGFGMPQIAFAVNSHLATLAEMIGMDPIDVHLRNAIRTGDVSVHGWKIGSSGLTECITRARDAIGWNSKYRRRDRSGSRVRGVGLGTSIHVSGSRSMGDWDGATVIVRINEDGRVTLTTGESDIGQGSNTILTQICAHELGIPVEHITVNPPDTDAAPYSLGTIGSRVTSIAGNAAVHAAREARRKLLTVAAERLQCAVNDLIIEHGRIHVVGGPSMTVAEAARLHIFQVGGEEICVRATYDAPTVMAGSDYYGNVAQSYSFAAQAVEVEVDTETGEVRLIDSFVADDCGKALNPTGVHGQTNGATAQGIGWTLYEGFEFDDGRLINGNFADYTLPTAESLPELRSQLVESNDPYGPYGAKGASETAVAPAAGAICSAIYDAVGIRIKSLPVTPEQVIEALRERASRGDSVA